MKTALLTYLALSSASAASWDYKTNGADWPNLSVDNNNCGGTNQSPIDLKSSGWTTVNADRDNWQKMYTNQRGDIEIAWNGHTSQTSVNKDGQKTQTFRSRFIDSNWGGPDRFTGVQFHFHHKSEHTVDGKYHDLEMHTVHFPDEGSKGGFIAAAVGIFWSVDDADIKWNELSSKQQDIITNFFTSLKWEETNNNPRVAEVPYGDLMLMVDTDNRWVYKGSVTTPPCAGLVYWNVVRTVYPLPPRFLEGFKNQLRRSDILKYGNYRVTGPVDLHDPHVISSNAGQAHGMEGGDANGGLVALCIILAVIFGLLQIFILRQLCASKPEKK